MVQGRRNRQLIREDQIPLVTFNLICQAWEFPYNRRKEWLIWAAKHQKCPTCEVDAGLPCVNMADMKRVRNGAKIEIRINKTPHDDRIDYDRLIQGLKDRGYYTRSVSAQVKAIEAQQEIPDPTQIDSDPDDMPGWAK